MKFNENGFIEGVGMAINNRNEQAIIYTKNGKLLKQIETNIKIKKPNR